MIDSFYEGNQIIAENITMSFPDFDKQFVLATDDSYQGAGAVLTQKHDEGK